MPALPRGAAHHLKMPRSFRPMPDRMSFRTFRASCLKFPRWIGLISSKTKKLEMFRRLKARGIPEEALGRVIAPVGLPIGAETPAEIAVSILGQIIGSVRNPAVDREGVQQQAEPAEGRADA